MGFTEFMEELTEALQDASMALDEKSKEFDKLLQDKKAKLALYETEEGKAILKAEIKAGIMSEQQANLAELKQLIEKLENKNG